MGMQMYGNVELILQGRDQIEGVVWCNQTGHVLNADGVGPHVLEYLGFVKIVLAGCIRLRPCAVRSGSSKSFLGNACRFS